MPPVTVMLRLPALWAVPSTSVKADHWMIATPFAGRCWASKIPVSWIEVGGVGTPHRTPGLLDRTTQRHAICSFARPRVPNAGQFGPLGYRTLLAGTL